MDKPDKTRRHFKSLRAFLNALRDLNDMREVRREVDTDLEIGAIIRRTHEMYAPAPLFTNIRGHAGYQLVGAPLSNTETLYSQVIEFWGWTAEDRTYRY